MAWSESRIFRALVTDLFENTAAIDLDGTDDVRVALYNNSITPDRDVTSANSAYNVDQWATANEVFEAGQWAQGGVQISGDDITNPTGGVVMFDSTDPASGSAADLASVFGCLVYDDSIASPVANQGICYNYFGGSNSVVNGTFTVVVNANGWLRVTV